MKDSTALPDWHQASCALDLVPTPEQDGEMAERIVTLAGKFMLMQGPEAGRRLEEVMLPWQRAAMKASFQCRESLWVLGKGSGKSVSVAAMAVGYTMLSHILGKNTRGLVAIVAPTIPSARIVFDHIVEAILADEELRPHFKSNAQNRSITHEASGIQIQVLPVDMKAAVSFEDEFAKNEEHNAETNGLVLRLSALKQCYGTRRFSAKDVADVINGSRDRYAIDFSGENKGLKFADDIVNGIADATSPLPPSGTIQAFKIGQKLGAVTGQVCVVDDKHHRLITHDHTRKGNSYRVECVTTGSGS